MTYECLAVQHILDILVVHVSQVMQRLQGMQNSVLIQCSALHNENDNTDF